MIDHRGERREGIGDLVKEAVAGPDLQGELETRDASYSISTWPMYGMRTSSGVGVSEKSLAQEARELLESRS